MDHALGVIDSLVRHQTPLCLNPCSGGSRSRSISPVDVVKPVFQVLIPVLVDHALGEVTDLPEGYFDNVLIPVLVDHALGEIRRSHRTMNVELS